MLMLLTSNRYISVATTRLGQRNVPVNDLEPGCIARIISGAETGEIVAVGAFLGHKGIKNSDYVNVWTIDIPVIYSDGKYRNVLDAQFMERLDTDSDREITVSWGECDWQPEHLKTT